MKTNKKFFNGEISFATFNVYLSVEECTDTSNLFNQVYNNKKGMTLDEIFDFANQFPMTDEATFLSQDGECYYFNFKTNEIYEY